MAVNPMTRTKRNWFLIGALVMLLIGAGVAGFLIYQIVQLKETIAIKEAKTCVILSHDVQSGTKFAVPEEVKKEYQEKNKKLNPFDYFENQGLIKEVYLEYAPKDALTKKDINNENFILETKINLQSGVVLSKDMVNILGDEVRKDTRIQEYNMVTLPSKLQNGNYIDIRLVLPSGQDFVVVSKKQVIECDTMTIWLKMTEDEIQMMNNAIVESYVMTGSDLYATVYNEAGLQEPADVTYAMSPLVDATFIQNPNLLAEAKEAYSQRNANMVKEYRQAIERQLSAYSEDKKTNIETGVEKKKEAQMEERLKYISKLDTLK